jgi:hypothetical protein
MIKQTYMRRCELEKVTWKDNAHSKYTISPRFSPGEGPDSRVGTGPVEVLGVFDRRSHSDPCRRPGRTEHQLEERHESESKLTAILGHQ